MNKEHRGRKIEMAGEYAMLDCTTCGFIHLDPIPSPAVLKEFYARQYYQSFKPNYIQEDEKERQFLEISFDEQIDNLERLTSGRKILEIGCGSGMFLELAAKRGWRCQGVEPSFLAVEVARAKGIDVYHGMFEEFCAADKGTFDVIYMKNVLQHHPDPQALLEVCSSRLSDKGVLFIQVSNNFEWMQNMGVALVKGRKTWISIPDHISYFNWDSLSGLLHLTGLKPVKRTTTFPIYGCLLFGINFIADKKAGAKANQIRVSFELFLERNGLRWVKHMFYAILTWLKTGRTIDCYCVYKPR